MKRSDIHSQAILELDEAVAYYELERIGLGLELLDEFSSVFLRVRQYPRAFPVFENSLVRYGLVRRFPYVVYFREFENYIWIVAVSHARRRPGYWKKRQPEDR